jgi:GTP:adenosylcobinamide-phosphate guanylyltransferase
MSEEKEILLLISKQLDCVSQELKHLNVRMDRLEGKTDDMHHYVPFVSWLETVGQNLSQNFRWLKDYRSPPVLTVTNDTLIMDENSHS